MDSASNFLHTNSLFCHHRSIVFFFFLENIIIIIIFTIIIFLVYTIMKSSIFNRKKWDSCDFFALVAIVNHVICLIRLFRYSCTTITQSYFDSELIKPTLNTSFETENSSWTCQRLVALSLGSNANFLAHQSWFSKAHHRWIISNKQKITLGMNKQKASQAN